MFSKLIRVIPYVRIYLQHAKKRSGGSSSIDAGVKWILTKFIFAGATKPVRLARNLDTILAQRCPSKASLMYENVSSVANDSDKCLEEGHTETTIPDNCTISARCAVSKRISGSFHVCNFTHVNCRSDRRANFSIWQIGRMFQTLALRRVDSDLSASRSLPRRSACSPLCMLAESRITFPRPGRCSMSSQTHNKISPLYPSPPFECMF